MVAIVVRCVTSPGLCRRAGAGLGSGRTAAIDFGEWSHGAGAVASRPRSQCDHYVTVTQCDMAPRDTT